MPDPSAKTGRRRLGETVAKEAAENACAHWGNAKNVCVADVMKTGDLEIADSNMKHFFV